MRNDKSLTLKPLFTHLKSNLILSLSLSLSLIFALSSFSGCEKDALNSGCDNPITLNKPFTAKIGETWCIPSASWQVTFGNLVEDSRCNVPNVECVWAGRYVMAVAFSNGEITRDTFYAVQDWRDTLYSGPYSVILDKVFPEQRPTTDPIESSAYSFRVIVK